jgi:3-hydroxyacyl-CoA dehydrogenase / enoyl-CoA hydratase / 3-hydroxybutyryl-CoA epimerase
MNMNDLQLKHWKLARDAKGIAWATLDRAGELEKPAEKPATNVLSAEVMHELGQLLDAVAAQPPAGLVFRSAKAAGFIAGADIDEFSALATVDGAKALTGRGWTLFERLAALPFPTLALVRGHCLGGGLELALACRYIVVVDEPSTKLALPEVMLGIFPGWGGMRRLPRRIGPTGALDLLLSGKSVDAKRAKRLGLADLCVPPRLAEKSAAELVLSGRPKHRPPLLQRLLNGPLKGFVGIQARKQFSKKARREHYPAPYAILDMWLRHDGNALEAPALIEQIVESPTARNLIRVFHLQERLKGFGKESDAAIRRVHVVGAGVMGGDIAAWCALRGLHVTLQDLDINRIAPAIARARKLFEQRLRGDRLGVRAALDRLMPDPAGVGARHADLVIEAIIEKLDLKRQLFAQLEALMRPDALLASNTSSLRLADLQQGLEHPQRLVGIHFFNPVAKMPLVEVVAAPASDPVALRTACAFVKQIDKLPLPVKDAPGFLVNAVLAPYMHAAMRCVDEGLSPASIDAAMEAFGMPMGPLELADTVGLDIALHAGQQLAASVAGAASAPPHCLAERVERGHLGRKSGRGFYEYRDGKKIADGRPESVPDGLALRLIAPLLERTQQLVAAGVVADADLADAGVIFGTGFAPFTGGPMNYLQQRGGKG